MKLTTKRNRWYFWRELFTYMIPVILIVGTIDVFASFIKCSLHPEWSAPCSVNWIFAVMYGMVLILTIFFAIVSAKMLKNIKRKIENEFFASVKSDGDKIDDIKHGEEKDKKQTNKQYHKKEGIIKMIEENKHEEDDIFEKGAKSKTKKSSEPRKKSIKKIAKKI